MSSKFIVLGRFESIKDDGLNIKVRSNFRNNEGNYMFELMRINLSEGISSLLIQSLETTDIIQVIGRLEAMNLNELNLVAEQITKISELKH